MSNKLFLSACALGWAALSVAASPLDLASVTKDSKWVIHLDIDAFRKTKSGAHILQKIVQPKIDQAEEIKKLNLGMNLQNISSITAFGPAFEKNGDGVMLIRTTADVKKDLDTLAGLSSLSGGQTFTLTHLSPYPLYSLRSNLFVAPNIANTVVIAKSKDQIEHARQVLLGKSDSLTQSKAFSDYPPLPNGFFFIGMAEGFNESSQIPPQAQVLRETRGGRLVLGETGDRVFANLNFKGKDEVSSTKIQQVVQGIVALISLTQNNKDLTELAQGTKISSEGNNVTITLQFPVNKALDHLEGQID